MTKSLCVILFALSSLASLAGTEFKCEIYTNGLPESLAKDANLGTLTVYADMIKGGLGKAPAKHVLITTEKNWTLEKLAEVRPLIDKYAGIDEVTHDDGTSYFSSVVLTTTPLGNHSFLEAEVGVIMTEKGPISLMFRSEGDSELGDSYVHYNLNCK